ncbi:MAG TPA: MaoC family dehydratase, partial [Acidimicrobiia bacterium]|nr:MaoC family dehydratase [Acidimicrobiia bacterium]
MTEQREHRRTRALDEETIEEVRARIGIPQRSRQKPHIDVVTADTIRHYALGYGDDNPLYCDPDYAATTSWRGVIGSPMFASAAGAPVAVEWTPEQTEAMRGGDPLGGMGQYMCGERWVFAKAVRPGMRITKSQFLDSADLKHSEFADGFGALVSHRVEFRDRATGDLVSTRYIDFWHAERDKTRSSGKYRNLTKHVYSADELAEIDRLYDDEL